MAEPPTPTSTPSGSDGVMHPSTTKKDVVNPIEETVNSIPTVDESANHPPTSIEKIKVHLVPVGSVPILKKTKFQIASNQRFASVHTFLRKILKLQPGDALFLYLQSAFCPGPDELLGDLHACFAQQQRGELVIHYSFQQAWG